MRPLAMVGAQFFRFAVAGTLAAVAHYTTLIGAVELGKAAPLHASLAGYVFGAAVSYLLNYHFTFASSASHHSALAKFLIAAGVGFLLNGAIMALLTGPFPVHYILAQFVATGTVLVWSFSSYRLWAFRTPARDDRSPNS
ncbi:MAG TPA: GtrA family protein [Alphaproteobacteria bacterium]|nr:GtrA family protein [Alphaproteobacteria bacterium]